MTETINAQLAALPKKSTAELKAMWQELHGKPAPPFSQSENGGEKVGHWSGGVIRLRSA